MTETIIYNLSQFCYILFKVMRNGVESNFLERLLADAVR